MTKRSTARLLIALSAASMLPSASAADLSGYRWKHRVLIVTTTLEQNGNVAASLRQDRPGIIDRDLVVIDLSVHGKRLPHAIRPPAEDLESLRTRYGLGGEPRNAFLLIGKDGGIKARQSGELHLDRLFALIDTMPMRKEEMRSRK
ncbi:MAG: protein of unknown function DUF4174 [Verrucomicrobia bacterium]|nr:MAG: protein of unknown function DUF4174 [Verrucomicrobiota bacterium]